MSNKQQLRAGLTGFFIALVVAVTSCMKVDITMPEGPRGADGLSAYEVWKAGVADGSIPWDKSATAIVDFFKFLKGKDGKDGLNGMSAYDQWKELVAAGSVDDPHNQGEKWPTYATTIQDFWRFLTGATGEAGQTPHIGADGNWWIGDYNTNQPARGPKGADGKDGKDGTSPVVSIGTNGNWYINGEDTGMPSRGPKGADGSDGADGSGDVSGHTIITIGENGNWFINGEDTGKPARGAAGKDGKDGIDGKDGKDGKATIVTIGSNGNWFINGEDTGKPSRGVDGKDGRDGRDGRDGKATVVTIGSNGHWFIDGNDTGVSAKGEKGDTGADGKDAVAPVVTIDPVTGNWLINGTDTGRPSRGADGKSPSVTIGDNGNWFVDGKDTGKPAKGADGQTPEIAIGENGNWFINGKDTGEPSYGDRGPKGAKGAKGDKGDTGAAGKDGKSTYELWKDYIADGTVPNPKDPSTTWPADKNTQADFFEYLCARTCVTCKEMEPKPTVELVNKTPGEEVDWKTGTATFIVKDGDGNPIPGAKVSNLPGMPGKSYTADPDGKITVPNEDLPSIQEKEPRTGETTVTSNGSTKKSTPDTYVPNRVEVRFVSFRQSPSFMEAQFPSMNSATEISEYNHKGVFDPVPAPRTNHVEYKVVLERRINPKDPWYDFPPEISDYIKGKLKDVQLVPLRVKDKNDPTSIDTDPNRQIKIYDNDWHEFDTSQNGSSGYGQPSGKRIIVARTIRRHMLKNFMGYHNYQENLYNETEDVYFTFKINIDDFEIYGVKPEFKTTFQLPVLQLAPTIKELVLQERFMDTTYATPEEIAAGGVPRFKKATFTFDYTDVRWDKFYWQQGWIYDENKKTGVQVVHPRPVPEEQMKSIQFVRANFIEYDFDEKRVMSQLEPVSNLAADNLGSFNHPTCHTDDPQILDDSDYRKKRGEFLPTLAVKSRIDILTESSGKDEVQKLYRHEYYHFFRPYAYGEIIDKGSDKYEIKYDFGVLGKIPTNPTKVIYKATAN